MSSMTVAETIFELFCKNHSLSWERVPVKETPTPDYVVLSNGQYIYFEIKQIDKDDSFNRPGSISSRTVGAHIRQRITSSKKQIQVGAALGSPSILLVYNNLDPMQAFGTEPHDFITAMYGEMTVELKDRRIVNSYHGRNSSLRYDQNTSFSAVGHLRYSKAGPIVRLYENVFASNSLDTVLLPQCFEVVYVEVTNL